MSTFDSSPTANPDAKPLKALNTVSVLDAARDGRQLTGVEALHLLQLHREDDLQALRQAADEVRQRQVGDAVRYGSAASLFLTSFCELAPTLYDYPKTAGDERGYVLTIDDLDETLERLTAQSIGKLYLSGGGFWSTLVIPGLEEPTGLKTYARVLTYLREQAPTLEITGFSPDEIEFLSIVSDRDAVYLLELFKDLGLHGLGGNGAEILVDEVRQRVSPKKASVKRWFEIVSAAATVGLPVQARLEAGPLETLPQRVTHLEKLRRFLSKEEDDKAFKPFSGLVPQMWTRLPATLITPKAHQPCVRPEDRLKLTAVTRLFLGDVLPDQQVFWQPDGANEAQDALQWGANVLGETNALAYPAFLADSKSARKPGQEFSQEFSSEDFRRLIVETGRTPELCPVAGQLP